MKILNLYAGIGGNRKKWDDKHDITAVEYDDRIANIYASFFPNDKIVVGDAHQYLLDHYNEFDLIWSSIPCITHSITNFVLNAGGLVRYPDMKLYEEVIFLNTFYKGLFVVENVKPYYKPLIPAQCSGRHLFWSNFNIPYLDNNCMMQSLNGMNGSEERTKAIDYLGFDLNNFSYPKKEKLLRNCCDPEIGLAILKKAELVFKEKNVEQLSLVL